ncbi:S8 family serine peptidase [Heliobacterium gestii]|uniref:S8 family serine peptidase n=1 Tax=Heliomicrobium gestii TaxID=2699 RepID=A0A845LGC1_HELGE|nr:S8/S53 family peptidase [Heliomicrobium gestii]MBM7865656.1 subtilisin family serine protease [Heliomicrobium gestii]MZP41906.1 S8 family serine peptidase [Heliomicrobium gestii]
MEEIKALIRLVRLDELMEKTRGAPDIVVAMIDGPVQRSHEAFREARFQRAASDHRIQCRSWGSYACNHGTAVAGILCGDRAVAPGICPGCTLLIRPIFCEGGRENGCLQVTPRDFITALYDVIAGGARIVNLSLGMDNSFYQDWPELKAAVDYAYAKGVLLITAAGNQGRVGQTPLLAHPWLIPVAACDRQGVLYPRSNVGASIGRQGLLAPGVQIPSAASSAKSAYFTGTSAAVPFVTGALSLLWSLYPEATAAQLHRAILSTGQKRNSVVPPLLNGKASWQTLRGYLNR